MKKFLSFAIAIVLCISLAGCAVTEKLTAFGLYTKAAKALAEAGGYEAEATITIDMQIIKVSMDMNIKQNGKNSTIVTSLDGETISTITTFDGIMYSDTAGVKVKTVVPETDITDSAKNSSFLPELASALFDDIEIEEVGDQKKITVNIDDEAAAQLMGSTGDNDILDSGSIENALMSLTFDKDGNLSELYFEGDAIVSESGVSVTLSFAMTEKFVNFGTAPKVTIPEDADEYVDGSVSDAA